jgi:hypothetical protein
MFVLILKIPDEFKGIIERFKKGQYSLLYTENQILTYVTTSKLTKVRSQLFLKPSYSVITKDSSYFPTFSKKLKIEFNLDHYPDVSDGRELELPPKLEKEILNYDLSVK